ncbi:threonine-phosphate decarboxylase [Brevundimonas goettingensis]|uniref:threonine-phosphate decarboxylase n=1 Tax=Brevundimonas goettingensis TaxID=2774190 RepID=UPI001CED274C|nr:threonine-phosphate decarboxylase [Brevundimonas goettingensis]
MAALFHGGRLAAARAEHPSAPEPWLDVSTGINPDGWRGVRAPTTALTVLPDPAETAALEAAAALAFGCEPDQVAAVPGAEAGLRLLPGLLDVARVAIAGPTYGSHADAWRQARVTTTEIERSTLFQQPTDALVVVNPNNPDGAMTPGVELVAAAGRRWLVIDESFVDTEPTMSAIPHLNERTVVLRSFGKFYCLPGLRLGFVVGSPELARRVRARTGDWPVSGDAIAMGCAAYADTAWALKTRASLVWDMERLDGLLTATSFTIVGGTPLFRLARYGDAKGRAWRLGEQGVLVRTFPHDPTLIRFGLPGRKNWRRLQAALEASR